ncbi:helix-turn-helix transcriptional regulator [Actinosynnema sp. ALI-1.44]|uniref:LuxR C-terminal-related transcriptional regulator n=1 Tax=Actinosynnema sp. ALI-1.44 TaxID=1933779 RepID=UPI00097C004F|nr:LuxR C-terminal-related transcriptional regulator [Actinosynnema sp. ALI-1.44]ONI90370.1 helix-turn-helix transcriptional regulator [Actinosynnema sp. ALI-1.44]
MERAMVSAAARIGYALGTSADVEWGEVFGRMADAIPEMCAVQVTGWDPVGRSHMVVAERGYQKAISDDLCHVLPKTRWGGQLFASGAPLLMDDMPEHFRASPHYQEWLHPAGLEDGLSAALRVAGGRQVGVLHLNAPVRRAFGEEARDFVAQIGSVLARRIDPLRSPRLEALLGPEWTASRVVHGGEPLPLTGWEPCPLVGDAEILELALRFGLLPASTLPFLWCRGGEWYRVRLIHVTDANRSGVVVASAPFANEAGLTAREIDVATGIVAGLSNQAIATGLVVSRRTVETYVERLLIKLNCATRGEVAGVAARAGLVKPSSGVGDILRLTRGGYV